MGRALFFFTTGWAVCLFVCLFNRNRRQQLMYIVFLMSTMLPRLEVWRCAAYTYLLLTAPVHLYTKLTGHSCCSDLQCFKMPFITVPRGRRKADPAFAVEELRKSSSRSLPTASFCRVVCVEWLVWQSLLAEQLAFWFSLKLLQYSWEAVRSHGLWTVVVLSVIGSAKTVACSCVFKG